MQEPEQWLIASSVRVESMVEVMAIMTGATTLDEVAGEDGWRA